MRFMPRVLGPVLLSGLLVSACGASSSGTKTGDNQGAINQGGVVRVGISGAPFSSLNKFIGPSGIYPALILVYPALVQLSPKSLDYVPDFSDTWETSPDGTTWTFHTRPGAKWSDGQPLTAEDVAFTLNMIVQYQKGPTANYAFSVANLNRAEATDANTVVLTYDTAVRNVLAQVQAIGILPEHVWGPLATGDGSGIKAFPNVPEPGKPVVSGGPFMITDFKKDDSLLFERNPNYYAQKPYIDGFGVKSYTNQDAMVSALKSGEIDAISGVPPTAVEGLRSANFTVSAIPGFFRSDLIVNSSQNKAKNRELLNPDVKRALESGIDRKAIAQVLSLGFAQPGDAIIVPSSGKWHNPDLKVVAFDPAEGNKALDDLGFARGADGTRVADGHPMAYEVILQPDLDRAFQIIQTGFQQLGIKLTPRVLDGPAAFQAQKGPDNKYADFDFALSAGGGTPQFDPDFPLSTQTCRVLGIYNATGYCNPEYDKLYQQQASLLEPERIKAVYQMQDILYRERPLIVLTYNNALDAWSNKFTGFEPSGRGLFGQIWIDTFLRVHRT